MSISSKRPRIGDDVVMQNMREAVEQSRKRRRHMSPVEAQILLDYEGKRGTVVALSALGSSLLFEAASHPHTCYILIIANP